eukprot:112218-Rhodomonas_salina.1
MSSRLYAGSEPSSSSSRSSSSASILSCQSSCGRVWRLLMPSPLLSMSILRRLSAQACGMRKTA